MTLTHMFLRKDLSFLTVLPDYLIDNCDLALVFSVTQIRRAMLFQIS